jgi:hypothetical protein
MIDEFDNKYRENRRVLSALDRVRAKVPLEPVAFRSAILQHLDAVARELDLDWYGERGLTESRSAEL